MEDTLRVLSVIVSKKKLRVLILVLMEDTLRGITLQTSLITYVCLNPCFNGRYSQSIIRFIAAIPMVLILVLMEDTLREDNYVSVSLSLDKS